MADEENNEVEAADAGNATEAADAADVGEELENVAAAAEGVAVAAKQAAAPAGGSANLGFIMDVTLQVTVEVGRAKMTIQDLLQLGQGSVVELEKLAGEPLDVYINGKQVARGEAVIINEKFGVRLTEIISTQARVEALGPNPAALGAAK
ncbi:MAG: flagellar motor switch protein FliN [Bdellovibrionales bacterium]|nr:flagellar motor switch protein FliN [Bdellovibrionales bacterium]